METKVSKSKRKRRFHETLPRMTVERTIYNFPPSKHTAKNYLFQNENPEFNLNPEFQRPFFEKTNLMNRASNQEISIPKMNPWSGFLDCTAQDREAQQKFHKEIWNVWQKGRYKDLHGLTNLEKVQKVRLNSQFYELNRELQLDIADERLKRFQERTKERVKAFKQAHPKPKTKPKSIRKKKTFKRNKVKQKASLPGKIDFSQSESLLKTDTLKNKLLSNYTKMANQESSAKNQFNFKTVKAESLPKELIPKPDGKSNIEILRWRKNSGEELAVVFEARRVKFKFD